MSSIRIVIPERKVWTFILFLPVWLVGWSVGEYFVTSVLVHGGTKGHHWGVTVFLLVWLAGWTFGGLAAIWSLCRFLFGKETIEITTRGILTTRMTLGFGKRRFYDAATIEDFRLAPESFSGHGQLLFDYGSETISMASGLDSAEVKAIFQQISETQMIKMSEPPAAGYGSQARRT